MKDKNFYSLIFFIILLICNWIILPQDSPVKDKKLLVIVLMVKNEENFMVDTLKPFVEAGLDSFLIFDTGSTDKTIKVTQEYFEKNNVKNGIIKQEPFIDFSTSRNRALELAEEAFPYAVFFLFPDAEWYMHNVQGLINYCIEHEFDDINNYLVRIYNKALDFFTPRLIRNKSGVRFEGVVHEVPMPPAQAKLPKEIYFDWGISKRGNEKSAQRWLRDRDLLLKSYAEDPNDPRTAFYLAQTYGCLQDTENTYKYLKIRSKLKGWSEEDFVGLHRLGMATETLSLQFPEKYFWQEAFDYYLQAYNYRPTRIEPLVRIAAHFTNDGKYALGFLFAKEAALAPYPTDLLFIEKELYEFTRFDVLASCAWFVGAFEIGKWALEKALQARPDERRLKHNLSLYNKALKDNNNNKINAGLPIIA